MKLNIRDLLFAFGAGYLYGRSVKRRELPRTRVNYNNLHLSKTEEELYTGNKIIKSNYSQHQANEMMKHKFNLDNGETR